MLQVQNATGRSKTPPADRRTSGNARNNNASQNQNKTTVVDWLLLASSNHKGLMGASESSDVAPNSGSLATQFNLSEQEVKVLLDAIRATNKKGEHMTQKEFVSIAGALQLQYPGVEAFSYDAVGLAFRFLDQNHDGKIDPSELMGYDRRTFCSMTSEL